MSGGGEGGLRLHIGERVSLTRRQKETGIDTSQCIQVGAWQVRSQKDKCQHKAQAALSEVKKDQRQNKTEICLKLSGNMR